MENPFSQSLKIPRLLLCIVIYLVMLPAIAGQAVEQQKLFDQINKLDRQYKNLSAEIYDYFNHPAAHGSDKFTDFKALKKAIAEQQDNNAEINALRLVMINLDLISQHIDDQAIFTYLSLLFSHNQWETAIRLYDTIKSEGDRALVSNASFHLAQYYLKNKQWQKCINTLDGISIDLALEDGNYASIIHGVALQKLKQHRKALAIYKKVPARSRHYTIARLNSAISMLRQGWWTDAQYEINSALNNPATPKTDEQVNRLYLVMGYLLLNNEYYRDSREAFRNVGLDSHYTNRSLLGIALTATSQEDYLSGLNALNILKNKESYDLSVDEAYLILPYIYEKLKQNLTATASYTEAMDYYTKRIEQLTNIQKSADYNNSKNLTALPDYKFSIENNIIEFNHDYPESIVDNIINLDRIKSLLGDNRKKQKSKLVVKIEALAIQYNDLFNSIFDQLITKRIEYLQDYTNQSRYGLARLYDNSITGSN